MEQTITNKKTIRNNIVHGIFVTVAFFVQTFWISILMAKLNNYYPEIALITELLAIALSVYIFLNSSYAEHKILWIMMILIAPLFGGIVYLLYGHKNAVKKVREKSQKLDKKTQYLFPKNKHLLSEIEKIDKRVANQFSYLSNYIGYPIYQNQKLEFFKEAKDCLQKQKEELKKAKYFIFMEYFAIENKESFKEILDILIRKVNEGVEVRILYDDVGSIGFINYKFIDVMESYGIKCQVFNKISPIMKIFMQNRDHRKMTVIDGKVGFTGGYNIADEYFGMVKPYGEWKDSGLYIKGTSVKSLTIFFLQMWNLVSETDTNYEKYTHTVIYDDPSQNDGYILPYIDGPLNEEQICENVYMNIIKNAKDYVYISTPYLIMSDAFKRELIVAAKRGIKIKIILPGIPDKKLVYILSRSCYKDLLKYGIEIFEYTPGFCHEKQWICDDEIGVVGTVNVDLRSLYCNFENAVLMYKVKALEDIKKDFEEMFYISYKVTLKESQPLYITIAQSILKFFAPLL